MFNIESYYRNRY